MYVLLILCICVLLFSLTSQKIKSLAVYQKQNEIQFCELYAIHKVNQELQEDIQNDSTASEQEPESDEDLMNEDESSQSKQVQFKDCSVEFNKGEHYEIHLRSHDETLDMIIQYEEGNIMDIAYE